MSEGVTDSRSQGLRSMYDDGFSLPKNNSRDDFVIESMK